jgi:hypothetical protein
LPRIALLATLAAVQVVCSKGQAQPVTVAGSVGAETLLLHTLLAARALDSTFSTIEVVVNQEDTGTIAGLLALGTIKEASLAGAELTFGAEHIALAAVEGIRGHINTYTITIAHAFRTHTLLINTYLTAFTLFATLATVVRVRIEINASSVACILGSGAPEDA